MRNLRKDTKQLEILIALDVVFKSGMITDRKLCYSGFHLLQKLMKKEG